MGQYWILVNIDKQEAIPTWKLGEAIYGSTGYNLYSQLRERQWKPVKEVMDFLGFPGRARKDTPRSLGHLELPVELIQMVFSNIEDPWTAFRLGCANTRLLIIGEKRIHQLMGLPHWRGDRIICVGDYCDEEDIPAGLDLGEDYEEFCDDNDSEKKGPYLWACTFPAPSLEYWKTSKSRLSAGLDYDWFPSIPPFSFKRMMSKTIYPAFIGLDMAESISPEEEPSVLWNLSKQVYFRRESIPNNLPKAAKEHNSDHVMGTILLLQICWSTDGSLSLRYGSKSDDIEIHRGKWAGDRFELTGNDVLESRLKEEGSKWEDVSEEVIKLLVDVFEAEG